MNTFVKLTVVGAVAAVLAACGSGDAGRGVALVRGVVVDVQSASLIEWNTMTVRTSALQEVTFSRAPELDLRFWRASHLREHMASGSPVTVFYRKGEAGFLAYRIEDG